MASRKSLPEPDLLPPLDFHPPSNGEFCPIPPTARAIEAKRRWLEMVEQKHKRLGMTRREFANSACGMAAALLAINQTACSGSDKVPGTARGIGGAGGVGGAGGCGASGCGMEVGGGAGTSSSGGASSMGGAAGQSAGGGAGMSTGGAGMGVDKT
jgi:hypothetical protein